MEKNAGMFLRLHLARPCQVKCIQILKKQKSLCLDMEHLVLTHLRGLTLEVLVTKKLVLQYIFVTIVLMFIRLQNHGFMVTRVAKQIDIKTGSEHNSF